MISWIDSLPDSAFIFPMLLLFGAIIGKRYVGLFLVVAIIAGACYRTPAQVTVITEPSENYREVTVTQYYYQNPGPTATQDKPVPGWTAAVSRDLLHLGWMGRRVYIEGLGVFKINDVMPESVEGYHVDIYAGSKEKAIKFGKRKFIAATVL